MALKINTRIEYFNVIAGMPNFGKWVGRTTRTTLSFGGALKMNARRWQHTTGACSADG
jgi:hypothetical protein